MKATIVYASIHHQNTKRIAEAINSELQGKLVSFNNVKTEDILNADLIGFGSGIYFAKFHKGLISFIDSLPKVENKKAFIFSTAGMKENILINQGHRDVRERLLKKNFDVIEEFDCKGYDTNGFLKYIGGLNKGRPSEKDIQDAKEFGRNLS